MKKRILFVMSLALGLSLQGQENLVPNPSFETLEGKIKAAGAISIAAPWKSVTMNPVDLYSDAAKLDEFSVPDNAYGKEKASTGESYAGVSFFGYMGRMPRTYLGTPLSKPLEAGKEYCMKFHVSLTDYSKYAVNNLGIYVSKEELTEKTDGNLSYKPQIKSLKNEVFEQQFLWTAICGVFKAEGGEQFITIGNFDTDADTKQKKIRLSREFSGKRQQNNGYYFVDDVSVIELNENTKKDCLCDKIAGGQMEVEFKSFGTDESKRSAAKKTFLVNSDGSKADAAAAEETGFQLSKSQVLFASKSFKPEANSASTIAEIVSYLEANPEVKLNIVGHIDASEASATSLAKRRAFEVEKMLVAKGIDKSRLSQVGRQATEPVDKGAPAKNRRVTFEAN